MEVKQPFPPWLRELCYFGSLILLLGGFGWSMKSDQRSTSEEVARLTSDLAKANDKLDKMSDRLPNREADALRFQQLQDEVRKNKGDTDFAIAKIEKWKDDTSLLLVKKGVM